MSIDSFMDVICDRVSKMQVARLSLFNPFSCSDTDLYDIINFQTEKQYDEFIEYIRKAERRTNKAIRLTYAHPYTNYSTEAPELNNFIICIIPNANGGADISLIRVDRWWVGIAMNLIELKNAGFDFSDTIEIRTSEVTE